ncbi:FliH/SctL family protein [Blastopirellula marina]|uniref:Flagellar assembly protein FliH n=1 Tax=Blastopirellula marina DSM 3645 TaxID=314230 RepID=A3ZNX4_9BACT|nr:flagellar assembly protein [Blastopirellula marina]EAQ82022.1 flagellar assembly protein [Blastopirellula marina DSM 3645]
MSVIKAEQLLREDHDFSAVAFNFEDVTDRAQGELAKIKQYAAKLIQEAQQEAAKIRQQAAAAGQGDATQKAQQTLKTQVDQQAATVVPALQQIVKELSEAKQVFLKEWEDAALHVACSIAEKIIRREVAARPEIGVEMIRETIKLASGCSEIVVHMNPADIDAMDQGASNSANVLRRLSPSQIVPDPALSRGSCRVETQFGEIDGQIETQLQRIEEQLK